VVHLAQPAKLKNYSISIDKQLQGLFRSWFRLPFSEHQFASKLQKAEAAMCLLKATAIF